MSLGLWLYHRKRAKLFVTRWRKHNTSKRVLAITYERDWELPSGYETVYHDVDSRFRIISRPDIVIEKEYNDGKANYESLYKFGLKRSAPKAFWFIDAHLANSTRMQYCDNFDFVFVAQSQYIDTVRRNTSCKNIFWLPLCHPEPPGRIHTNTTTLQYPISFIGRYGEGFTDRNKMIDFLQATYGSDFFVKTDYTDPKILVQATKLSVNHSIRDDLNFRVFQTLAYGSQLITNHVPDIDKIAGLKERLHCFNNLQELKSNIDMLLEKDVDMEAISNAQNWIANHHTLNHRLSEMLEMINTGKQVEYK